MDPFPLEGIQVNGEGGDKRFSLAGFHFRNFTLMENDTADHLDVEVAHPQRPFGGLANDSEGFWEKLIE